MIQLLKKWIDLKDARLQHLEDRNKVFQQIKNEPCPKLVIEFMLFWDKQNLKQSRETYSTTVWKAIDLVPDMLDENIKYLNRFNVNFDKGSVCDQLKKFLEEHK